MTAARRRRSHPRRRLAALARRRLPAPLVRALVEKVPRDHREPDAAFRRRRQVTVVTSLAGAGLLGTSLHMRPGSPSFYPLTLGVAATWTAGGLRSGPLHLGWMPAEQGLRRPIVTPVLLGAGAFGAFYAAALIGRTIPGLRKAIASILEYADAGSLPLVWLVTIANGLSEEVFFRGALYAAVGTRRPVTASTGIYALATVPTGNPALVLAAAVMGALFGLQRRASGGILAPMLTHVTWSTLMLLGLPPLFREVDGAWQARR